MSNILLASEVSLFDMNSWWWAIVRGLYWVINAIEQAYYYLVGVKTISNNAGTDAPEDVSDILFLNITDPRVQKAFMWFFIFGALTLLIFLAIGMIKASFQDNDQLAARGKMIEKSFLAFFIMLLLPLIMYVGVVAVGAFIRLVNSVMQHTLSSSGMSLAENIHQICLPTPNQELTWDSSYTVLKKQIDMDEYQYVMAMLSSGILIFVLISICTSLVERLIEVVFLYLISPFVLARTPLDDGGSFKLWKDIVIAKMLSAAGVIISMYLYFILMQNINTWFAVQGDESSGTKIAKEMVRILFCIGGAFAAKKGALSVAQVISQNTGISEGMSQGQSLHMLSSGLNLGMSAIRGGLMGMAMAGKAGGGGVQSALGGLTTGSGRASVPTQTGDAFSRGGASGTQAVTPMTAKATAGGAVAPMTANGKLGAMSMDGSNAVDAGAFVADNAGADTGWTDGLLSNPNMGGEIGRLNRARQAGGGLGTAFLYGGGLIGGTVAAAAYLGRKAVGGAVNAAKFVGHKITGSNMWQGRKAARAAKKENKFNASVFNDRNKLNKEVNADMKKLAAASAKIDRKYGSRGKGYNSTAVESIKRARLGKQVQYIERKVKRLTNAGGAYQNTLNRFNRMTNSNYENKTNTNGGGKI